MIILADFRLSSEQALEKELAARTKYHLYIASDSQNSVQALQLWENWARTKLVWYGTPDGFKFLKAKIAFETNSLPREVPSVNSVVLAEHILSGYIFNEANKYALWMKKVIDRSKEPDFDEYVSSEKALYSLKSMELYDEANSLKVTNDTYTSSRKRNRVISADVFKSNLYNISRLSREYQYSVLRLDALKALES
jgi:hypothetical protein